MKFNAYIKIFLIIFLVITNNSSANSKENKILLKINKEIITSVDILNEIKFLSIINKEFKKIDKNKQIQIAKNALIKDKVKKIELLKFKENLVLDEADFENLIKNYLKSLGVENFKDYELFFKINNLDINIIKKKISIDTFWKALVYQKFYKKIKVDKDEIRKNISKKEKQREYMISEIVFTVDKDENLKEKQARIFKLIKEKSFTEAALTYSISDSAKNGGKLGWIKENILNKKIKNELRNLNKKEFTNIIIIPGGFLILKKEDFREVNNKLDIEKEIRFIIEKKTNDQLEKFSNIYLNKLKKNIIINEI